MAKSTNTTRARAPKVTAAQANAFMGKLFDPLPDAELADPEIEKLERRALRKRWDAATRECRKARIIRDAAHYTSKVSIFFMPEQLLYARAVDAAFGIPAPDEKALRWKLGVIGIGTGLSGIMPLAEREAIIDADEARLSGRAVS